MRILITGSGGRLGRLLYAAYGRFSQNGVDIEFQSRGPGFDLTWQPTEAPDLLPECDVVIALWGATSGSADTLALNSELVKLSRRVALSCGAKRLFHMSSAAVYGPGADMDEHAPLAPRNDYGAAKLALEQTVARHPVDDLAEVCLRVANVVGADSLAPGLKHPGAITLDRFENGNGPLRSYIGADDLLAVFCALAQVKSGELPHVLNVAAPEPIAMQSLAQAAGKAVEWRDAPPQAIQEVTLDVSRMRRLLPHTALSSDPGKMIADWHNLVTQQ